MIKAVLFDLDGTLLDTNELIYKSFVYTFKEGLNRNLSKGEITSFYGQPLEDTFKNYINDNNEIDRLIKMYREYNEKINDNMCYAFDEVEEMLLQLKNKGIKIGIVTSKRESLAKRGMEIAGILKYMDVIVTPECTKNHKPHSEPALYAIKNLNIDPREAIMVGDSNFDLICGRDAGCKTWGVRYTEMDIKRLEDTNPDYFINSPKEILDLV